jgi:O-antigen/teichoic acid export membrane protein
MNSSSNRVALNTGIIYCRMILTIGVSLYSTRLILSALGSTDYGIFNLIAGVIAMLAFLNAAMATSTQRFLSFYQGKNDLKLLQKVFTNSLVVHLAIAIIIALGLEVASIFLFDDFLNIPPDRVETAKTLFHFMVLSVFISIIVVPFTGSLYARENMLWVAVVNTLEALLKLAIAFIILKVAGDKLIIYGILMACLSLFSGILYATYCFRKYAECTIKELWAIDKKFVVELTSFAGWNMFGSLCVLGRTQGLAIMLNLFFGTVINAAYAISNQVSAQLSFFSNTMLQAMNPQIMKSEGANDRERMLRLAMIASKFCFFLLAIIAIPCIFEMTSILGAWLKNVPEFTVMFCRLTVIGMMVNQLTIGLQSALQATGKIKVYQIVVGSVILLNLPIAYLLLKLGLPAYAVLLSYAVIELVACTLRLIFLKKVGGLSIKAYLRRVTAKEVIPVLCSIGVCFLITTYMQFDFRFVFTIACSGLVFLISIYFAGLCADERKLIDSFAAKYINLIKTKLSFS